MKRLCQTIFCFFLYTTFVHAQSDIALQLRINSMGYTDIGGRSTQAVFKFYQGSISVGNCLDTACIYLSSNDKNHIATTEKDEAIKNGWNLKNCIVNNNADSLILVMENYEDDRGEVCNYDKGDDDYAVSRLAIPLSSLLPGIYSAPFTIGGSNYSASISVRHVLPQLYQLILKGGGIVNDVGKTYLLACGVPLKSLQGITFKWQFKKEGGAWTDLLEPTDRPNLAFNPQKDVFGGLVKQNESAQFRVQCVSTEMASDFSAPLTLFFTPPAPYVSKENLVTTPTCNQQPAGTITADQFHTVCDSVAWFLVKGTQLQTTDYPDIKEGSNRVAWGKVASRDQVIIPRLGAGPYTLVLYNPLPTVNSVFSTYRIEIKAHPRLRVASCTPAGTTCDTTADGTIAVQTEGGAPGKINFFIDPSGAVSEVNGDGHNVLFRQLTPGNYTILIKDECDQIETVKNVVVPKGSGQTLTGDATVEKIQVPKKPAIARIKVTMKGGSGEYLYTVTSANVVIKKAGFTTDENEFEVAFKDNFKLQVTDKTNPCLSKWETVLSLNNGNKSLGEQTDTVADTIVMADRETDVVAAKTSATTPSTAPEKEIARTGASNQSAEEDEEIIPVGVNADIQLKTALEKFYQASVRRKKTFIDYDAPNLESRGYKIVIEKSDGNLIVLTNDEFSDTVVIYPVVFGKGGMEIKQYEGDQKTPEGVYTMGLKKEDSRWAKFLSVSYPNTADRQRFEANKQKHLIPSGAAIGGSIGIHGTPPGDDNLIDKNKHWTNGCIATKNEYIEELYAHIPEGTLIIIKP